MNGYEALDVTAHTNAYDEVAVPGAEARLGEVSLRGLPFVFAREGDRTRVVRVLSGQRVVLALPGAQSCTTVTFAHRVATPSGPSVKWVGREDATYVFVFEDGSSRRVSIREGFEIAAPWMGDREHWGLRPSLALPDQGDSLPDRTRGAFADAGRRQTEVVEGARWAADSGEFGQPPAGWSFYLWSWLNSTPNIGLKAIELVGGGAPVEVGGICLGFENEYPLRPEPARSVVAAIPWDYRYEPNRLTVEVDRGSVGYTTSLAPGEPATDRLRSWGDKPGSLVHQVYARVSALPSAKLRLVADGKVLHEAGWRDLRSDGSQSAGFFRVVEHGRNWVHTRFVDDATDEPVACRVNFSTPEGVPFQPHGHPHHVNSDLDSWHNDVGGDVRLGRTTYAYVSGTCQGWLPRGQVRVQVARGFEYWPIDETVSVDESKRTLTFRLKRLCDPTQDGWYSGDTHVHFLSTNAGLLEAAAEGLSVVNLLQSQWGSLFTNAEDFVGRPVLSSDGKHVVYTSQENRQHFLGHISLLGLKEPVMPWCTDGPSESEMGDGLEATVSSWADHCHAQGGTTIVPHFPVPNSESATLIVTGRADALELAESPDRTYREYYRYLNAGFSIPLAGGTDKMTNDVPVGLSRTYVQLKDGEEFGFDSWCAALRAGRTYVSSGPILELLVEGTDIGGEILLPSRGGHVEVRAFSRSIFPLFRLELVWRGEVVASTESSGGANELSIAERLAVDGPGWLCARVGGAGPTSVTHHRDGWKRAIVAHSSPIYVACGEQRRMRDQAALDYITRLVRRARSYVTDMASYGADIEVRHHHDEPDHGNFLQRPFDEAESILRSRVKDERLD